MAQIVKKRKCEVCNGTGKIVNVKGAIGALSGSQRKQLEEERAKAERAAAAKAAAPPPPKCPACKGTGVVSLI